MGVNEGVNAGILNVEKSKLGIVKLGNAGMNFEKSMDEKSIQGSPLNEKLIGENPLKNPKGLKKLFAEGSIVCCIPKIPNGEYAG